MFKDEKAFKNLLILDSLRGEHSTGIAALHEKWNVSIAKSVGDPFTLFDTISSEKIFKQMNNVLIGHNRFATTGKITKKNAHPFEFNTIIGAHNGTLSNKHDLPNHGDYEVDSQALFACIEKEGIEKTIARIRGAWALTWFDSEELSINFLRNKERPLFYVFSKDGDRIYWASERWMLRVALSRNEIEIGAIEELAVDMHMCIPLDKAKRVALDPVFKKVKGAAPLPTTSYPTDFRGSSSSYTGSSTVQTNSNVITLDDKYLGTENDYEILYLGRDSCGGEFVSIRDAAVPTRIVRIYVNRNNDFLKDKLHKMIRAKVVGIKKENNCIFYKASFISIEDDEEDDAIINRPRDEKGNTVSEEDHKAYYDTCMWCSSPLQYNEEGMVYANKEAGAVCKWCKDDPTVKAFL